MDDTTLTTTQMPVEGAIHGGILAALALCFRRYSAQVFAFVLVVAAIGCAKPAPDACLAPSSLGDAPVTRFGVHFLAGDSLVLPGNEVSTARGVTLRPSKARFYVSQPVLVDSAGARVNAELVDESGARWPYGVVLLDFERPESMALYLRAPTGSYRALSLSIGVPPLCESGEGLNHSDASAMQPPLDVDSDMYWSWNPGYVFLKFEGNVAAGGGKWEPFLYHVGADERFATLELPFDFAVTPAGGEGPELLADFDRLLITSTGESHPDVTDSNQRAVHGGELADALVDNIRRSGFLRLAPSHH